MDPDDWSYLAEGGASVVLYCTRTRDHAYYDKVVKLMKSSTQQSAHTQDARLDLTLADINRNFIFCISGRRPLKVLNLDLPRQ